MTRSSKQPTSLVPADETANQGAADTSFSSVLETRMSRRSLLRGGTASAAGAIFASLGLSACGGSSDTPALAAPDGGTNPDPVPPAEKLLGFSAVPKSLADTV